MGHPGPGWWLSGRCPRRHPCCNGDGGTEQLGHQQPLAGEGFAPKAATRVITPGSLVKFGVCGRGWSPGWGGEGANKDETLGGKTKQPDFKGRNLPQSLHIHVDSVWEQALGLQWPQWQTTVGVGVYTSSYGASQCICINKAEPCFSTKSLLTHQCCCPLVPPHGLRDPWDH